MDKSVQTQNGGKMCGMGDVRLHIQEGFGGEARLCTQRLTFHSEVQFKSHTINTFVES